MSHTLANRCEFCEWLDDVSCPECKRSSYEAHGATRMKPFRVISPERTYIAQRTAKTYTEPEHIHQWHWDCPNKPADHLERVIGGPA